MLYFTHIAIFLAIYFAKIDHIYNICTPFHFLINIPPSTMRILRHAIQTPVR